MGSLNLKFIKGSQLSIIAHITFTIAPRNYCCNKPISIYRKRIPFVGMFDDIRDTEFGQFPVKYRKLTCDNNKSCIKIPDEIPKEKLKISINKKTNTLEINGEANISRDINENGWLGSSVSKIVVKRSIVLPEYVSNNDDLLQKIETRMDKDHKLIISVPEDPKQVEEKETDAKESELVNIEITKE